MLFKLAHLNIKIKVESDDKFERIGGSTIGEATLWGLGSLLTNASVSI